MKVAVLSLTRDRLTYTQACFASLEMNAGCGFDHFVLDQASEDGTAEWLEHSYDPTLLIRSPENVGISRGLNQLLDQALAHDDYDAIVKIDNDCQLTTPNTLADVAAMACAYPALLSPHILGLNNPPKVLEHRDGIDVTFVIGGIFLAAPAEVFTDYGYRHDESNPVWGGDDYSLCQWFTGRGGTVGYLSGYEAWHYETTDGQVDRFPAYFDRRVLEGGPAR